MKDPGRLDQRITFRAVTRVSDGIGGTTDTWANVASTPTVWAAVEPLGGTETTQGDRIIAPGRFKFTVRTRSDISEVNQIRWRSEIYNIRAIHRAGPRPLYMVIEAERGISGEAVSGYDVYVPVGSDSYLTSEGDTYTVIAA